MPDYQVQCNTLLQDYEKLLHKVLLRSGTLYKLLIRHLHRMIAFRPYITRKQCRNPSGIHQIVGLHICIRLYNLVVRLRRTIIVQHPNMIDTMRCLHGNMTPNSHTLAIGLRRPRNLCKVTALIHIIQCNISIRPWML